MTAPPQPPLRLVLVRPRNPENLGAVARALANFGLSDWALVALGTHDFASARRVAVHAQAILDRPRLCATLDEAVADCAWVVGTSSRRVPGRPRLHPAEVGCELARRAPGRTALVLGDERSGLTNAEVLRCDALSGIPSAADQPSLNLAQAAVVYLYVLQETWRSAAPPPVARVHAMPAADAELLGLEEALRAVLRDGGFLVGPERHAVRDLAGTLRRAGLTRKEVGLWRAALRSVHKRLVPVP